MLRMLRRLIGEEIDLAWHPAKQLWPLKMDPSQVNQILANLCVNARDAIDGVGKITIATDCCSFDKAYCATHRDHAVGDYVRLSVRDNGCGMDQAILNYIFEPFFTTKDVNEGTGLGLATVYGIVKQNNGFITVQSETGCGTTFNIHLPRCLDAEQQAQPGIKSAPHATRGETVLLVEDEPAILHMGEVMLKRLGYHVLTAGTPAKALLLAKEQARPIELLITDVVMPEMNGRQLSEQLQALCPGLKTLYMSGYTASVIARRGILEEGVNFIQKPYSPKDLGAKVRKVLDQP
jgi:CheY-like chemotaxis protein